MGGGLTSAHIGLPQTGGFAVRPPYGSATMPRIRGEVDGETAVGISGEGPLVPAANQFPFPQCEIVLVGTGVGHRHSEAAAPPPTADLLHTHGATDYLNSPASATAPSLVSGGHGSNESVSIFMAVSLSWG